MTTQIFIGVITLLVVKLTIDLAARTRPLVAAKTRLRRGAPISPERQVIDCIPGGLPQRLTHLDEVAAEHGALTPRRFWRDQFDDVARAAQEGRWEALLDERIRGLEDMRGRYAAYVAQRKPDRTE